MLVARMFFWASLYCLASIQTLVVYKLFSGPELTVASGFIIFGCRAGGMSGYAMSGMLLDGFNGDASAVLWACVFLVGVSFFSAASFLFLRKGSATARAVLPLLEAKPSQQGQTSSPTFREQLSGFS